MASSAGTASPSPRNKTTSLSSSFASRSSPFLTRSSSPTCSSLYGPSSPSSSSVRCSIDRPTSPRRSMSVTKQRNSAVSNNKRMCMCAPTTHPGSFRCSYHKRLDVQQHDRTTSSSCQHSSSVSLNLRRSTMKKCLVRIGCVEGELVKRTFTTLIRPSSLHQRRREAFQPKPSRLSIMSKAED